MENTEEVKKGGMNKIVLIVIVIVVLAVIGYFAFGRKTAVAPVASAAMVNGVIIPKADYDTQLAAAIAASKTQGVDVTDATKLAAIKTQVMDNLISNELVAQGIKAAGIKATPEEIEKQFQAILTQTGGADKLKEELVKANITEAKLRENIAKQIEIQAYLLKNIDVAKITVTSEEIAQFYADYSKAQKATNAKAVVPALKDVSEQIKQQITSNKQQALIVSFIASLRAAAKIETTPAI